MVCEPRLANLPTGIDFGQDQDKEMELEQEIGHQVMEDKDA